MPLAKPDVDHKAGASYVMSYSSHTYMVANSRKSRTFFRRGSATSSIVRENTYYIKVRIEVYFH